MNRFHVGIVVVCLGLLAAASAVAAEFGLTDGTVINGELASANASGAVFRLDAGGFSERIPWSSFSQTALERLAEDKQAAEFAEPYLEVPIEDEREAKRAEIKVKPVPRVEHFDRRPSLYAALTSPGGLALLLLLLLANVYVAYEIALFRNQPPSLVCAVSALAPVIGPIIFLCLPAREFAEDEIPMMPSLDEMAAAEAAAGPGAATSQGSLTSRMKRKLTSAFQGKSGGGLTLRRSSKPTAAGAAAGPRVFKRGEVDFNRRFFETQCSGFFRLVPSEAEKDLVLFIRAGKSEYVAKRISRISASEMHVQLQHASGASEVNVPFDGIIEIQIRHKDHKS